LTPGTKKIAGVLAQGDWSTMDRLKLTDAQEVELKLFLHGFLIAHLGRLPKGREAAIHDNI
jgi:hypothetical protein